MTARNRTGDILTRLAALTGLHAVEPQPSPGFEMETASGFKMAYPCPHLEVGKPAPYGLVYALLSEPFTAYCLECFIAVMHASTQNNNCDVCGNEATAFREVQVGLGRLMLAGNVCMTCHGANGWTDIETHLRIKLAAQKQAAS